MVIDNFQNQQHIEVIGDCFLVFVARIAQLCILSSVLATFCIFSILLFENSRQWRIVTAVMTHCHMRYSANAKCRIPAINYKIIWQARTKVRVHTLLILCTKCEGKFVPVAPTRKMLLSMCSVLAWAGGRAGILTDSWQLCQPIRGKLRLCQPMTGCVWEHATSWTTESAVF